MSPADNCLYWQAIFRLMAVQYHCHSLIMADTSLSDTAIVYAHVGANTCLHGYLHAVSVSK